ncbi:hypothetical protein EGW08_009266 [Elysia chlorotica]|uniref:Uncharacterized protein n=1 Tax=Elysia chlorotica TaxID=188477 RepID=A0A3S1BGB4_ELYCH|nr:hypothetical protein EGW08_009266 [Elysia chlorotica]
MDSSSRKFWGAENFSYEESPHPSTSLRIPGLTHESFDNTFPRNPKITSIMHTSTVAREYANQTPLPTGDQEQAKEKYFLDWPLLTQEFFMFASCSEFVMSRALYEKNTRKWPLDMKFTLGNVGACSVATTCDFFALGGSEPLWTNTNQAVSVDKKTRMPARLPDWFLEKYRGKGHMDRGLIVKPFDRPTATYAHPSVGTR